MRRQRVQWRRAHDKELVIDPDFFFALRRVLPRIRQVRVHPKDGRFANELNLFRYDVVLQLDKNGHLDEDGDMPEPATARPWRAYANRPLHEQSVRDLVPRLREHLRESLPDYMLPASVELLDELPLLPSGKVDRAALSRRSEGPDTGDIQRFVAEGFVAPRNPVEEALAGVWSELLGIDDVGVDDNFFELGGDSILSIQVIAKIRQLGFQLSPRDLFERQTIAGLAELAGEESPGEISTEQGLVTGPIPLTPTQQAFFEWDLAEPWHYNLSVLLETHRPLGPALVAQAAAHLFRHHDALRLRFVRHKNSGWRQHLPGLETVSVLTLDLSRLSSTHRAAAIEASSAALQASLDLERGPIFRVGFFDLGPGRTGRLLIAVHHLAVDRVSWGILLEDLESVCRQLEAGRPVTLPAKTTSLSTWAERLRGVSAHQELDAWLSLVRPSSALPVDLADGPSTIAATDSIPAVLGTTATRALLHTAPDAGSNRIETVLLTALVQAFADWTGSRTLGVELERHGREEELFDGVDLLRTVGWFTAIFPVVLTLPEETQPEGGEVEAIHAQLAAVPGQGIGYGRLRYLEADPRVRGRMAALPQPEVFFNYSGRLDRILPRRADSLFTYADESWGPPRSRRGRFRHGLMIAGGIVDGRLSLKWTYGRSSYRRSTVEELVHGYLRRLEALVEPGD